MQTQLAPQYQDTPDGQAAEAILRQCVHCGFCTATCPTYQLLGDELDGPRGRIYLIKQVLEGAPATRVTQQHLDRCLTCRACESTCPSGVRYGELVEVGRRIVDEQVPRSQRERSVRWLLREGLTSHAFAPAYALGQTLRPLLPASLKAKVAPKPTKAVRTRGWPQREHARKVVMLLGCVQPAMAPEINLATAHLLDACGIQTLVAEEAGCCGALRTHLNDGEGGLADMKRAIDAWWPLVDGLTSHGAVEAIIVNASGCGAQVKEYGHALARDPAYAEKAARISALARDPSELVDDWLQLIEARFAGTPPEQRPGAGQRVAWHPPCTLQHAQRLKNPGVEKVLQALGYQVRPPAQEAHLCCGSAGTYSVLQPELSQALRTRKLNHLQRAFMPGTAAPDAPLADAPDVIASANIGCLSHLQAGTGTPVRHWLNLVDDALSGTAAGVTTARRPAVVDGARGPTAPQRSPSAPA